MPAVSVRVGDGHVAQIEVCVPCSSLMLMMLWDVQHGMRPIEAVRKNLCLDCNAALEAEVQR